MRRITWGLLVVALGFGTGSLLAERRASPGSATGPETAVRAILDEQQSAWNEGKVDLFLEGYWKSDNLTFSGSQGITRSFAKVQERYRKSYPDRQAMGKLDFTGLEVHVLNPDAALVLGHWHLTREKGDIGGVFSLVFQRFPEGWRIIHDHTSVVAGS
ncbi:MAG TPA: nuclear transport factor 2 family protein [Candidatus Dormibacteraeota bacterium]|nr:nuclear transport factor 2 family protein [Candidatus Dormibacteraeota bacterium]